MHDGAIYPIANFLEPLRLLRTGGLDLVIREEPADSQVTRFVGIEEIPYDAKMRETALKKERIERELHEFPGLDHLREDIQSIKFVLQMTKKIGLILRRHWCRPHFYLEYQGIHALHPHVTKTETIVLSLAEMKRGICKLCLNESDLCDSHYVSKAVYALLRTNGDQPIMMSAAFATLTDRQVKKPLLCFDCEQRFSKNGENYALSLINREDNIFKALELINAAEPRQSADGFFTYFSKEAGIDDGQLAYFAVSTVWRGGVASWNTSSRTATGGLQLGKHEESMRRYLLGEIGFPADLMVRLMITTDLASRIAVIFPWHSLINPRLNVFSFVIRGLWFEVVAGDRFPPALQRTCCVRLPEGIIFVGDRGKDVVGFDQHFKKTARVDKRLQSLVVK